MTLRPTLALSLFPLGVLVAGCSQSSSTASPRSLERSGAMALTCLANYPDNPTPLPITSCRYVTSAPAVDDYSQEPHLLALLTQTARGEVAVVDITAQSVIDLDPATPGNNFIPVGQAPSDIAATSASSATFVAIADPNRPGLWGLPMDKVLPGTLPGVPGLTSFPACALPAVPGRMLVLNDPLSNPADPTTRRAHCPAGLLASAAAASPSPGFGLDAEFGSAGTPKIVVALPDLGQLAVIDAQDLLARVPGSFDPCPIEARLSLRSAEVSSEADAGASGDAGPRTLTARPSGLAVSDDGRLFVGDENAPFVHELTAASPCSLVEREPLLSSSFADPSRTVTTTEVAVSPLTSAGQRFLYAVDQQDGTLLVFDVSDASTSRAPVQLSDPLHTSTGAPDRISFAAPVRAVTFARRDEPDISTTYPTGASVGAKCDPTNSDDPHKPPSDYVSSGAGPRVLRGVFGFAALDNGQVGVIDVDDLDAACRQPLFSSITSTLAPTVSALASWIGCSTVPTAPLVSASDEATCSATKANRIRSSQYIINSDVAGRHAPSMQAVPLLYTKEGSVLAVDATVGGAGSSRPRMIGPDMASDPGFAALKPYLAQAAGVDDVATEFLADPTTASKNWVAFDLSEPRAHFDETWSMTYEGRIPGFDGHVGTFQCADTAKQSLAQPDSCELTPNASGYVFYEASAGFCSLGVLGVSGAALTGFGTGDILEVRDSLLDSSDAYWGSVVSTCSYDRCSAAYGTPDTPVGTSRERRILEAYDDRLVLEAAARTGNGTDAPPITCCFPRPATYSVRGGSQWIVVGSKTGFLHHVTRDPTDGHCVPSSDARYVLRNGRARTLTQADLAHGLPTWDQVSFKSPQMRFGIWAPPDCLSASAADESACIQADVQRDMYFSFTEAGGFQGLVVRLSTTYQVLPQAVRWVPMLDALALPDASSSGLYLFSLNTVLPYETVF